MGPLSLLAAIVGAVTGLSSYVLYAADLINSDTSANFIIVSLLGSLIGVILAFAARRRDSSLADGALVVGGGTLGVWLVVVAVALGR